MSSPRPSLPNLIIHLRSAQRCGSFVYGPPQPVWVRPCVEPAIRKQRSDTSNFEPGHTVVGLFRSWLRFSLKLAQFGEVDHGIGLSVRLVAALRFKGSARRLFGS